MNQQTHSTEMQRSHRHGAEHVLGRTRCHHHPPKAKRCQASGLEPPHLLETPPLQVHTRGLITPVSFYWNQDTPSTGTPRDLAGRGLPRSSPIPTPSPEPAGRPELASPGRFLPVGRTGSRGSSRNPGSPHDFP
ncbi:hypothetical protein H1C71_039154, partial [Ictidomys tridecemlineatus]